MEKIRKCAFFALVMIVIGIVGSFGYTLMIGEKVIAVCVILCAGAVVPTVVRLFDFLSDRK